MADLEYQAIVDALVSHALTSGQFERVNAHEPKNSPGNGITAAVWVNNVIPIGPASGLDAVTLDLVMMVRCYTSMVSEPADAIDPNLMGAANALFSAYCGDFTLDGLVRNVDIFGSHGVRLSAKAGYLDIAGKLYRVIDLTVPLIVNDVYDQAP